MSKLDFWASGIPYLCLLSLLCSLSKLDFWGSGIPYLCEGIVSKTLMSAGDIPDQSPIVHCLLSLLCSLPKLNLGVRYSSATSECFVHSVHLQVYCVHLEICNAR